jgi:hypothetical protein
LKKKKCPGWDHISTEHLVYGGDIVVKVITCIFNHLRATFYIPSHFKKGIRIPIFKGGNKDKHNKDDHRTITLLPMVSKLYEMAMMGRAEDWFMSKLDTMQGAGRKGLSSLHTSLVLRESVAYNVERGSNVHVVLLDTRKAFDTVWQDGLFYQLHLMGMDKGLWKSLRNLYTDFQCAVRVGGAVSRWFRVTQGVHQGGVMSMHLYIMFINPLLVALRKLNVGCHVHGVYCASPCSADDLALIALFRTAMQEMLDMVHGYSCTWRYQLNPLKCMCISFGSPHQKCKVHLGKEDIPNVKSAIHVGVSLNHHNSAEATSYTELRIARAKRSFYPMLGLVRSGNQLSPVVASKLYWATSLNSMLYGAETWDLSDRDMMELERAHIGMARIIQGLPPSVASAGVLIPMGWYGVAAIRDKMRCNFLAKTIAADTDSLPKRITLLRIQEIRCNQTHASHQIVSPIKAMVNSCRRLGLLHQLYTAVDEGGIQSLAVWKRDVKTAMRMMEVSSNLVAVALHPSLEYILPLVPDLKISNWWMYANKHPRLRIRCRLMIRLALGYLPGVNFEEVRKCWLCDCIPAERDTVCHFLTRCQNPKLLLIRRNMQSIISKSFHTSYMNSDLIMYVCVSGNMEDENIPQLLEYVYQMHRVRVDAMGTKPKP